MVFCKWSGWYKIEFINYKKMKYFLLLITIFGFYVSNAQLNMEIEKSPNFRTYNNLKNIEGKTFKSNVLFRSGSISSLMSSDKEKMAKLKLNKIVDFRTDYEVSREPDDTAGLSVLTIRIPIGNITKESSLTMFSVLNNPNSSENTVDSMMLSFYKNFSESIHSYKSFFRVLLEPNSNVLFHCSAGKDRTGIASVLLLKALDFDDDTILDDFMRSNDAVRGVDLDKMKMYGIPEKYAQILMKVKPEYLKEAISIINLKYGSLEKMMDTELGIGANEKKFLKAKYLN